MNLQSRSQEEQQEYTADAGTGAGKGADTQALEQARKTIAHSPAPSFVSPPTVMDALESDYAEERARATMATLETLSALEKGLAQKQKTAELQHEVDEMIQRLARETIQARRRRIMRRLKITGFIAFVTVLLWKSHWSLDNWWLYWWFGGGAWAADKTMGKRRKTVNDLERAGDPRAVGVLAITARDAEKGVSEPARQVLQQLLPSVRADHAGDITPPQMNALLELAFRSEPAMQIAVLKALEQIGDARAVPVVQNLSLSPHPQVREQAKHCLPFLNERVRRAEQSATLLRGTANPAQTTAPRELLRPVSQTADTTPANELLRPDTNSYGRDKAV